METILKYCKVPKHYEHDCRYNCNKSSTHLSKSGTNKFIKSMLLALSKIDYWQNSQVTMNHIIFSGMSNSKRKTLSSTEAKKTLQNFKGSEM